MQLMRWVTAGSLKRCWWAPISSYQHLMPWHRQFSTSAEIFLLNNLLRSQHVKEHLDTTFTDAHQHWWARTFRARVWTSRHQLMHLTRVPTCHRACEMIPRFLLHSWRETKGLQGECWHLCTSQDLLGDGFWSSPKPARVAHSHKIQSK